MREIIINKQEQSKPGNQLGMNTHIKRNVGSVLNTVSWNVNQYDTGARFWLYGAILCKNDEIYRNIPRWI